MFSIAHVDWPFFSFHFLRDLNRKIRLVPNADRRRRRRRRRASKRQMRPPVRRSNRRIRLRSLAGVPAAAVAAAAAAVAAEDTMPCTGNGTIHPVAEEGAPEAAAAMRMEYICRTESELRLWNLNTSPTWRLRCMIPRARRMERPPAD